MTAIEYDRDFGDEDDHNPAPSISSGLCSVCGENEALPEDEVCEDCAADILGAIELEEA